MPGARWRPTPRAREWRRTSSCERYAAGEHHRMPRARRARDLDRWIDHRLRGGDRAAENGGGLVRHVYLERAVPSGGKEDAWVRAGGTAGLDVTGRGPLSNRRRNGIDRDVESVRRNGEAWVDW